ncbi:MAG: glyceraldehyde-3-phosphate dehydrogenase [Desulfobacterales bacterium]|jgi:glyceraldehyde 3-phosphate dehydrogenase|nr:glyceraldehyde-3-phosphate dehydrogenase [Desulfobacterales bacterium]
MNAASNRGKTLGINGLGRIGKLTLWHHVGRKSFGEIVVNLGRPAGRSLADLAHYVERDSTYGRLQGYLYGHRAQPVITDIDEARGRMLIDGVAVTFLRTQRDPARIGWGEHGVRLVVDTTGRFLDPTAAADAPSGSLRGHLACGAEKVVVSAPFKVKDKTGALPADAVTTVMGVNGNDYDPKRHRVVSAASCTTTCLAHMMRPLIMAFGARRILSASMATVHAATSSQEVLDRLPEAGKTDLRKSRSILNNIILTSTGAANALRLVIPAMKEIPFIAESVRIPASTGSLIILVVNLQEEPAGPRIDRRTINALYQQAAADGPEGYLIYTEEQNVSADIVGMPRAAAIIEGHETHTRTAEAFVDLAKVPGVDGRLIAACENPVLRIPVTQAVIYGWYDNEKAGYVHMLGDRTVSVADSLA